MHSDRSHRRQYKRAKCCQISNSHSSYLSIDSPSSLSLFQPPLLARLSGGGSELPPCARGLDHVNGGYRPRADIQPCRQATVSSLYRYLDFAASFLAFFSAFRSFGVIEGCFLPSFFVLRSFDIPFASYPLYFSDALACMLTVNPRPLSAISCRSPQP